MRHISIAVLLFILASCGIATPPVTTTIDASAPVIALHVREVDNSQVVTFDVVNTSSNAVSIIESFGYDFYFHLDIVDSDGVKTYMPRWELTREIGGRCLSPNQKRVFRVPLTRWEPVVGLDATCANEPCNTTRLLPGTYQIRATYRPYRASSVGRCAPVRTDVVSDWMPFKVMVP